MGEVVSVIGGGWSFGRLSTADRERIPGYRIGINDAGIFVRTDCLLSMDRLWTEERWNKLVAMGRPTWIRTAALKNRQAQGWTLPFDCDHKSTELSDKIGQLNGTNSGMCGLNLAYQRRPDRIILWGFDMGRSPTGDAYWYPPYPWASQLGGTGNKRYQEWSQQFEAAAKACAAAGIEVLNASPHSKIPQFEKIDPRKVLA